MKKYELHPLSLLQDVPHRYKQIDEEQNQRLAWVSQQKEQVYEIVVNIARAKAMYEESWVKDSLDFQTYLAVITFHEVCHVKFHSFDYMTETLQDIKYKELFHYIHNVLEDSRIEHFGSMEWPIYTQPLDILLGSLRWSLRLPVQQQEEESLAQKKVNQHLKTLFYLTRFGIVAEESDALFLQWIFSLIITSKRMERKPFLLAPLVIYAFLEKIIDTDPQAKDVFEKAICTLETLSQEEAEALANISSQDESEVSQIMESSILDAVRAQFHPLSTAGLGDTTVHVDTQENAFIQQVIARYADEIMELCQAFRLLFEQYIQVNAYDGELAIEHQQEAYFHSLSGDDDLDYYRIWQKTLPDLDVVIIRDVSWSTKDVVESFAASAVMLHVALKQIPGVRSMDILFSDDAEIDKDFDKIIEECGIVPRFLSGTNFVAPLEIVKTVEFRAKKKLAVVITDGDFYKDDHWPIIEELQERGVEFLLVKVVSSGETESIDPLKILPPLDMPLYQTTIKSLPLFFYAIIRQELFRRLI